MASDNRITAIYTRVSTGYQVDRDSLPFQRKELKAYCEHILHVAPDDVELFEDAGKSGKNTARPAFQRMMRKIKAGLVSRVVVYKIDRISRNLIDFSLMYEDFKENNTTFISLNEQFDTSSAIGEAVLKIILVFAELERKLTSERVTGVMIGRAKDGKWNGARMPYGWAWDEMQQSPVHDEYESDIVRTMYNIYLETKSTNAVKKYLLDNGIPTKRGGLWTSKAVGDILHNPINKGDYRYNYRNSARGKKKPDNEVVYVPGLFPPIVSGKIYDTAQKILADNFDHFQKSGTRHASTIPHVFKGLMICDKCGRRYQVMKSDKERANGFKPTLYKCYGRASLGICDAANTGDKQIGGFVFNLISNLVAVSKRRNEYIKGGIDAIETRLLQGEAFADVHGIAPDDLKGLLAALQGIPAKSGVYLPAPLPRAGGNSPALDEKRKEAGKVARALERLKKAYLFDDAVISESEYISTRAELESTLARLNNDIADLAETAPDDPGGLSFVSSAADFLLSHKIQSGDYIDYPDFAGLVGNDALSKFTHMVIDHITLNDTRVTAVCFHNGLKLSFIYKV